MKSELILSQFKILIDAPNGIQKLRELILQLAVQGKLVPQDPNDENASVLLSKIEIEEGRLINEGIIKKRKPSRKYVMLDVPFEIPKGWEWVRLHEVGYTQTGTTPPKNNPDNYGDYIPLLKPANLTGFKINYEGEGLSRTGLSKGRFIKKGSVLMVCIGGSIGKTNVAYRDVSCNQQINSITPYYPMDSNFLFIVMKSKYFQNKVLENAGNATLPITSKSKWETILIPLPSVTEQKRIVAKVNQLMALCDELEKLKEKRTETKLKLNDAALFRLMESQNPDEFPKNWNLICDNFDLLYDTPETVTKLRQAILQLAVQGKLVEQDPADEPASVFTSRIKEDLGIKSSRGQFSIMENDLPLKLPKGWCWSRFPELGEFGRGKSKHRPRNDPKLYIDGEYKLVQTGDVARANCIIETFTGKYNDVGLSQSKMWPTGTMCITIAANIADSGILGFDACFPDSVVGFIPSKLFPDARYFEYFIRTVKQKLTDFAPSTAQKNINLGILKQVLIPIPPLNELVRIIEKLDYLMNLCDELESSIKKSDKKVQRLMDSVTNHFLCS